MKYEPQTTMLERAQLLNAIKSIGHEASETELYAVSNKAGELLRKVLMDLDAAEACLKEKSCS